jgi:plasmid maintenance system antidote protein VapI
MEKDLKYRSVKALIEKGEITEFGQIFDIITLTKVAVDLGTHTSTLSDLNDNVGKMNLERMFKLSELLEVSTETMLKLLEKQYYKRKKPKK